MSQCLNVPVLSCSVGLATRFLLRVSRGFSSARNNVGWDRFAPAWWVEASE
jgi:hypothetical protein